MAVQQDCECLFQIPDDGGGYFCVRWLMQIPWHLAAQQFGFALSSSRVSTHYDVDHEGPRPRIHRSWHDDVRVTAIFAVSVVKGWNSFKSYSFPGMRLHFFVPPSSPSK